uniref:Uncharacterized protein n=1 Tax=Trepomonas sp. PC1 TaxID=1076344 RepID=A0A146KL39_9EUKA|eukprot:JAP96484.1 hypothetical protein TPC1_10163 [Trepomonas sp. PC1]
MKNKEDIVVIFTDSNNTDKSVYSMMQKFEQKYSTFKFYEVDKQDQKNQYLFEKWNHTLPFLAASKQSEQGFPELLLEELTEKSVEKFLKVKSMEVTQKIYGIESELDLLDVYEFLRKQDALILYENKGCDECYQAKLHMLKVAQEKNLMAFSVLCDLNDVLGWMCARRSIRGYPWVQFLQKGKFYDYDYFDKQKPNYQLIMNAVNKPEFTEKSDEVFTEEWMAAHPTKVDVDGNPLEWPAKPNLKAAKKKLDSLYKKIEKMEKELKQLE